MEMEQFMYKIVNLLFPEQRGLAFLSVVMSWADLQEIKLTRKKREQCVNILWDYLNAQK